MFQTDAGRTVCTRPYGTTAWPLVIEGQRLPRKVFRRSIALLSDSLSTLRSADYSNNTQDSLPVAGQALLDGLSTRRVPLKGFKVVDYISFRFPKLLDAIDVTGAENRQQICSGIELRPFMFPQKQDRDSPKLIARAAKLSSCSNSTKRHACLKSHGN